MITTPLDQAIAAADDLPGVDSGIGYIALACGTSRQFINKMRRHWRQNGEPPRALREYAATIECAVKGAVRAEALYPAVRWERDERGVVVRYSVEVSLPAANDPDLDQPGER